MTKTPSFADRWPPHPTPPHGHRLHGRARRAIAALRGRLPRCNRHLARRLAVVGTGTAGLLVAVLVLTGALPGVALLIPIVALLVLIFVFAVGWDLPAAIAPLPDVHTPPVEAVAPVEVTPHVPPGDDTLTALADSVGGNHARTETIPVVTP